MAEDLRFELAILATVQGFYQKLLKDTLWVDEELQLPWMPDALPRLLMNMRGNPLRRRWKRRCQRRCWCQGRQVSHTFLREGVVSTTVSKGARPVCFTCSRR